MAEEQEIISWNDSLENLVAQESERCGGLSWLHTESERYFSLRNNSVAIPVIILSTVNGFLSGSSSTLFNDPVTSSIGVGLVSLFTGILSTLGSYFAWAKRTEAHRISGIQYQKLSRSLAIELSLPKSERIGAKDILKVTKEQIERLMEISPAIPIAVVELYKKTFPDRSEIAQPEVIAGFKKVHINKWVPDAVDSGRVAVRIGIGSGSASGASSRGLRNLPQLMPSSGNSVNGP